MDVFEKLKNGEPVDMMSEEYGPAITEYRPDMQCKKIVSPMLIDKVSTGLCIIKFKIHIDTMSKYMYIHFDTKSE